MSTAISAAQGKGVLREELFSRERRSTGAVQELTEEQLVQKNQELEMRIKELTERIDALTQSTTVRQVKTEELNTKIDGLNNRTEEQNKKIRIAEDNLQCWSTVLLVVGIASLVIIGGIEVYKYI